MPELKKLRRSRLSQYKTENRNITDDISIHQSLTFTFLLSISEQVYAHGSNDGAPRALNVPGAGQVPFAQTMGGTCLRSHGSRTGSVGVLGRGRAADGGGTGCAPPPLRYRNVHGTADMGRHPL